MRCLGIIRVSQRKGDNSEHSPEVQARAMLMHAGEKGWSLDPTDILDENVDVNGKVRKVSGSWDLSDRPKLLAAIEAVESGTHKIIMAERFDRLFRNIDIQRYAIDRVEAAGGRFETIKQGIVTHATAEAELHANLDGVINQYQRRTAKERSWDAVEVAIAKGKWPGPVPPGYLRGEDRGLVPDPDTVAVVKSLFKHRVHGATYGELRDELAQHGIGRTVSGIRKMLSSRVYVGEIHFGTHTPNLSAHEPIIDRETFGAVQRMKSIGGRKAKSPRLLARLGVLKCGVCGGRMSASINGRFKGIGGGYHGYRCASQADHGSERPQYISADMVEVWVWEKVAERLADARGRASMRKERQAALEHLEKATNAYSTAKRRALLADIEDDHEAIELLGEMKAALDERQAVVDKYTPDFEITSDLDDLTFEERRQLIRAVVSEVRVNPGQGRDRITLSFRL